MLLGYARKEYSSLKQALRALEILQSSLSAKIAIMERTLVPATFHHGIHALPNEILTRILKNVHVEPKEENEFSLTEENIEQNKKLLRLALVNRRFRNLVYSIPLLWNLGFDEKGWDSGLGWASPKVSPFGRNPTNYKGMYIQNSSKRVNKKRFGEAMKYSERWVSLNLRLPQPTLDEYSLRRARHLKYLCVGRDCVLEAAEVDRFVRLLVPQNFSNLTELHIGFTWMRVDLNLLPQVAHQLTTLSLCYQILRTPRQVDLLIAFITSATQLRQLRVECAIQTSSEAPMAFEGFKCSQGPTCLPFLESFSFHIPYEYSRVPAEDTNRFFPVAASIPRAFIMPKLRSLEVKVNTTATFAFEDMFPVNRDYTLLRQVKLECRDKHWCELYSNIFSTFSQMQSLSLYPGGYSFDTLAGALEIAKLREFDIKPLSARAVRLVLDIFNQAIVNLESITMPQAPIGETYMQDDRGLKDDRYWTDFLRWKLKNKVHVQFASAHY